MKPIERVPGRRPRPANAPGPTRSAGRRPSRCARMDKDGMVPVDFAAWLMVASKMRLSEGPDETKCRTDCGAGESGVPDCFKIRPLESLMVGVIDSNLRPLVPNEVRYQTATPDACRPKALQAAVLYHRVPAPQPPARWESFRWAGRRPARTCRRRPRRWFRPPAGFGELGRRQAVRQRILIPPCGGSNPPAPANTTPPHLLLLPPPSWRAESAATPQIALVKSRARKSRPHRPAVDDGGDAALPAIICKRSRRSDCGAADRRRIAGRETFGAVAR